MKGRMAMRKKQSLLGLFVVGLLSCAVTAAQANIQYPITVTDDMGREVVISSRPERLVSLAPSWTEILFSLGLEDQVVGVTTFCDYPPAVAGKQKVGGFSDPNIELIVALKADVVFGTTIHQKVVTELERRGIKFICQKATSVEQVRNNVRMAAMVAGVPEQAEAVTADIDKKIALVRDTLSSSSLPYVGKRTVLYLVWDEPVMSLGPKTLISDLITLAGGISMTRDAATDYPSYSLETVIAANPDVVLAPAVPGGAGVDPQALKNKAGWRALTAVRQGNVRLVDDNLVSRAGPRVGEGVLEMARAIYPELFK
ncbi:MAG: ABC transporter substrate-binding protein [Limnochordia bacterium]|jgi:iron complex transport system substrate-binding protein